MKLFHRILSLFLILVITYLTVVANTPFSSAQNATNVSGIINTNTTWTKADSPYNLTGNVLIEKGVTVTIQADTIVNLDSYYIRVNGSLIVEPGATINMKTNDAGIQVNGLLQIKGTNTKPIRINGAYGYYAWMAPPVYSAITFSRTATGWNDQTKQGAIIENTVIDSTFIETNVSIKIGNNHITSGGITLSGGTSLVINNFITSSVSIKGGSPTISQNNFAGGFISFYDEDYSSGNAIISDNIIDSATGGNSAGIWFGGSRDTGGTLLVIRNQITNCYQGIMIFSSSFSNLNTALTIQDNTITDNSIGIFVTNSYTPTIIGNNIENNELNIKLATDYSGESKDFSAANNWWGTTDTAEIEDKIWDYSDDFDLGKVNYIPFLTKSNSQAGPNPNLPTPTINPSLIPSSTPTSNTTIPTQNPTTPNQEEQTEIIVIITVLTSITIAVGAIIGVLAYLARRK